MLTGMLGGGALLAGDARWLRPEPARHRRTLVPGKRLFAFQVLTRARRRPKGRWASPMSWPAAWAEHQRVGGSVRQAAQQGFDPSMSGRSSRAWRTCRPSASDERQAVDHGHQPSQVKSRGLPDDGRSFGARSPSKGLDAGRRCAPTSPTASRSRPAGRRRSAAEGDRRRRPQEHPRGPSGHGRWRGPRRRLDRRGRCRRWAAPSTTPGPWASGCYWLHQRQPAWTRSPISLTGASRPISLTQHPTVASAFSVCSTAQALPLGHVQNVTSEDLIAAAESATSRSKGLCRLMSKGFGGGGFFGRLPCGQRPPCASSKKSWAWSEGRRIRPQWLSVRRQGSGILRGGASRRCGQHRWHHPQSLLDAARQHAFYRARNHERHRRARISQGVVGGWLGGSPRCSPTASASCSRSRAPAGLRCEIGGCTPWRGFEAGLERAPSPSGSAWPSCSGPLRSLAPRCLSCRNQAASRPRPPAGSSLTISSAHHR